MRFFSIFVLWVVISSTVANAINCGQLLESVDERTSWGSTNRPPPTRREELRQFITDFQKQFGRGPFRPMLGELPRNLESALRANLSAIERLIDISEQTRLSPRTMTQVLQAAMEFTANPIQFVKSFLEIMELIDEKQAAHPTITQAQAFREVVRELLTEAGLPRAVTVMNNEDGESWLRFRQLISRGSPLYDEPQRSFRAHGAGIHMWQVLTFLQWCRTNDKLGPAAYGPNLRGALASLGHTPTIDMLDYSNTSARVVRRAGRVGTDPFDDPGEDLRNESPWFRIFDFNDFASHPVDPASLFARPEFARYLLVGHEEGVTFDGTGFDEFPQLRNFHGFRGARAIFEINPNTVIPAEGASKN